MIPDGHPKSSKIEAAGAQVLGLYDFERLLEAPFFGESANNLEQFEFSEGRP